MPNSPYFTGIALTESVSAPLSKGILTQVSIMDDFPARDYIDCLSVTLYLVRGTPSLTGRITPLCGGFVDSIASPSWTGAIEVSDDDILVARGNGQNQPTVRFSYSQITLTTKGAIYQFLKSLTTP